MPTWESIRQEAESLHTPDAYDVIRRKKLDAVRNTTGRHLIVYASDFTTFNPLKAQVVGGQMTISLADKDGFDEVTTRLGGGELDVLLHSPGGSPEATESIVNLLRSRFVHLRFIVPNAAKSAATMMAMAGEQLLLDDVSELGPTDPQMVLVRDGQQVIAPAQAIKDEFEKAQQEVNADPSKLPSWIPVLREYGPSLLAQCDNALALTHDLVAKWLAAYMFKDRPTGYDDAQRIAAHLANHNYFRSHGRRIGMSELQDLGVNVLDLRMQPSLRDAIRDYYIALMLTFSNSGAYKVFENSRSKDDTIAYSLNVVPQPPMPTGAPGRQPTMPQTGAPRPQKPPMPPRGPILPRNKRPR